ncbi:response regulator [Polyangium aurulentum]|uniref:response regulator n=1 Tax=Polyangium aurulentum TaxID=2567896 RepID=UPI0010ADF4F6|nr:response regulator [Polyangium aurulentum]UQA56335.1 response regulator [Polyangium aurulentum]
MKTVLLVEDEYDLQQAVKGLLEDDGYEVIACGSGEEALEALEGSRPDLMLLDLMLPYMSGDEVLETVRCKLKLDGLPVIVMSAVRTPKDEVVARSQGFLKKPFSADRLLSAVRKQLEGARR